MTQNDREQRIEAIWKVYQNCFSTTETSNLSNMFFLSHFFGAVQGDLSEEALTVIEAAMEEMDR